MTKSFTQKKLKEFDEKFNQEFFAELCRGESVGVSYAERAKDSLKLYLSESIEQSYELGKVDGMSDEATNCYDHTEQGRAEARERIIELIKREKRFYLY